MCAAIGVDPLTGGGGGGGKGGGWWTEVLGLGEWQYELAVQVVDICVSTRERNGGMIEVTELINRVEKMRGGGGVSSSSQSAAGVTKEDILRSLDLLRPLHAGYSVHPIGSSLFVRSIPRELDTDQSLLLVIASDTGGRLTEGIVADMTGWNRIRCRTVLEDCVMREGLGWRDDQGEEPSIWLIAAVDFGDGHASLK